MSFMGTSARSGALCAPSVPSSSIHSPVNLMHPAVNRSQRVVARATLKQLKDRMGTVKSTQKITESMKLVAAAKVRSAQDAVLKARPLMAELTKLLYEINLRVGLEQLEVPLCENRPVKAVLLTVFSSDRGLCGGYNNKIIKLTKQRHDELKETGVNVKMIICGKKANGYFTSSLRDQKYDIPNFYNMPSMPTASDAIDISTRINELFSESEVDKVELVYSKFISLTATTPDVQPLLPLAKAGMVRAAEGGTVLNMEEDVFKLTSDHGELSVKRETNAVDTSDIDKSLEGVMVFDADPNQILEKLMPLYLDSLILRSLQEALASELSCRMQAMSQATDNAKELYDKVSKVYFRTRQAKITTELIEVISGATAATSS